MTHEAAADGRLEACCWGHAGDGNVHSSFSSTAATPPRACRAAAAERVFDAAISLGGTVTGEHGVGLVKSAQLAKQLSPAALGIHHAVKQLFDPKDLLNRGKRSRERRTPHRPHRSRHGAAPGSEPPSPAASSHRTVPAWSLPTSRLLAVEERGPSFARCPRAAAGRARRGAGRAGDGRARRARQRRRDRLDDERSRDAARGLGGRLRGQRARDVLCCKHAVPGMAARRGLDRERRVGGGPGRSRNRAAYCASKGAVVAHTRARRRPRRRRHPGQRRLPRHRRLARGPAPRRGGRRVARRARASRWAGSARPRRSPRPSSTSSPRSSRRARCSFLDGSLTAA